MPVVKDTNAADIRKAHINYMSNVAHAAMRHCLQDGGIYYGEDGCHRLARECGASYCDFERQGADAKDIASLMSATYSGICVIAYGLKPPVDAGTWLGWLREGYEYAKEIWEDTKTDE